MADTALLKLPLVQAAQAQKHVTVNEALARLDGLVLLTIQSQSVATPPAVVSDGAAYVVPIGAVNEWAGQDLRLAIGRNGGWDFVQPRRGWRALIADEGVQAIHDGANWRSGMVTLSPKNAGLSVKVIEIDHQIGVGASSVSTSLIPANAIVLGVTARVVTAIIGSLTSWQLGNPGAVGRYGSGLGLGTGSYARGVLSQPTAFYAATPLQLDATGGNFAGGVVRLAVHYLELALPDL